MICSRLFLYVLASLFSLQFSLLAHAQFGAASDTTSTTTSDATSTSETTEEETQADETLDLSVLDEVAESRVAQKSKLVLGVEQACPVAWEDVKQEVVPPSNGVIPWEDETDKETFVTYLNNMLVNVPAENIEIMSNDLLFVSNECISQRVRLLNVIVSTLPQDVVAAMAQFNQLDDLKVNDGFLVGDIRMTARLDAADGWVFLQGQTIGDIGSGADMESRDFKELFKLARSWKEKAADHIAGLNRPLELNDSGSSDSTSKYALSWEEGGWAKLPDNRGKAVAGVKTVKGDTAADMKSYVMGIVGADWGQNEYTLSVEEMPAHDHKIHSAGKHTHGMSVAGAHTHKTKQENAYASGHQYTRTKWAGWGPFSWRSGFTSTAGAHKHTIYAGGEHTHKMDKTGGGKAFDNMQDTVFYNVEMKYTDYVTTAIVFNESDDNVVVNDGGAYETAAASCNVLHQEFPDKASGVYWIRSGFSEPIQAYCDMESHGGGWTLVVAQFEKDPVTNWNEGTQEDYNPSLVPDGVSFVLNTVEIPEHTQVAFGQDYTLLDFGNLQYVTGDIDASFVGQATNKEYFVHRSANSYFGSHDAKESEEQLNLSNGWENTLTFDEKNAVGNNWAFSPNRASDNEMNPGFALQGVKRSTTSESFAWTVWVR